MKETKTVVAYRPRRTKEELLQRKLKPRFGATRYCAYGNCKSDSRNADEPYMQGVSWIPFPKPHLDIEKCRRWVSACGREDFTEKNVKRWTYMCSKHFVGGNGPSEAHPDPIPIPVGCDKMRVRKFNRRRQTPATNQSMRVAPQTIDELDAVEALMHLQDSHPSEPMRAPLTSRPIVERNVNEAYVDDDEHDDVLMSFNPHHRLPVPRASFECLVAADAALEEQTPVAAAEILTLFSGGGSTGSVAEKLLSTAARRVVHVGAEHCDVMNMSRETDIDKEKSVIWITT